MHKTFLILLLLASSSFAWSIDKQNNALLEDTSVVDNIHYELDFHDSLERVGVTIYLHQPTRFLQARNINKNAFISAPVDCHSQKIIPFKQRRISLSQRTRCIRYLAKLEPKQDPRPFGIKSTLTINAPSEWLLLPELNVNESVTIKVIHSPDFNFSSPWSVLDKHKNLYTLQRSPESATGLIILGDFEYRELNVLNTQLRVAYLPGGNIDYAATDAWLKSTVTNVANVYGRFPHPNPQIIVSPVGKAWSYHRSPVPYGRVIRDAGESVQFFIDQRQSLKQFNADWTATHEFSHLLLPYIHWNNRWISEGFASYYQNILMARANEYSERKAWTKLYDGLMRGKRSAPELSANSAARESGGTNMKVYWSGAALALMADVQLREQSNGKQSLDTVLGKLQKCCLPSNRTWSGTQLMRKLDELSHTKVFSNLYRKYANQPGFFSFEKTLSELGISVPKRRLQFEDNDKKKALRESIIYNSK